MNGGKQQLQTFFEIIFQRVFPRAVVIGAGGFGGRHRFFRYIQRGHASVLNIRSTAVFIHQLGNLLGDQADQKNRHRSAQQKDGSQG